MKQFNDQDQYEINLHMVEESNVSAPNDRRHKRLPHIEHAGCHTFDVEPEFRSHTVPNKHSMRSNPTRLHLLDNTERYKAQSLCRRHDNDDHPSTVLVNHNVYCGTALIQWLHH